MTGDFPYGTGDLSARFAKQMLQLEDSFLAATTGNAHQYAHPHFADIILGLISLFGASCALGCQNVTLRSRRSPA
jgi:hypothetical protein